MTAARRIPTDQTHKASNVDAPAKDMCEGYWDKRLQRWVSLEEIEDQELEDLLTAEVHLPPPSTEPRRKPAVLMR